VFARFLKVSESLLQVQSLLNDAATRADHARFFDFICQGHFMGKFRPVEMRKSKLNPRSLRGLRTYLSTFTTFFCRSRGDKTHFKFGFSG
jgi:hypothetical protein